MVSGPTVSTKQVSRIGHCLKMGQGQPSVIICINFVELENILLHAKFQDHTTKFVGEECLKVFTINEHGGHLGHVTCKIYINFLSYFPRRLHIKFGFAERFQRRRCFIMYIWPRDIGRKLPGVKLFSLSV